MSGLAPVIRVHMVDAKQQAAAEEQAYDLRSRLVGDQRRKLNG